MPLFDPRQTAQYVSIPRRVNARFSPRLSQSRRHPRHRRLSQSPEGSTLDFHQSSWGSFTRGLITMSQSPEGSTLDFHHLEGKKSDDLIRRVSQSPEGSTLDFHGVHGHARQTYSLSLNPPKGQRSISTLRLSQMAKAGEVMSQSPEGSTLDFHPATTRESIKS